MVCCWKTCVCFKWLRFPPPFLFFNCSLSLPLLSTKLWSSILWNYTHLQVCLCTFSNTTWMLNKPYPIFGCNILKWSHHLHKFWLLPSCRERSQECKDLYQPATHSGLWHCREHGPSPDVRVSMHWTDKWKCRISCKLVCVTQNMLSCYQWDQWMLCIDFRLTAEDIEAGSVIPLRFVKFQNVQNVTVSIKGQHDAEVK